jgi:large subunit ribosomal protein L23
MNPFSVLIKPILSEKSLNSRETQQKYTFLVEKQATKLAIKKAVEKVFEVEVQAVNTSITRGKVKRRGAVVSTASAKKKAVVTLKPGHKIKMFEDQ